MDYKVVQLTKKYANSDFCLANITFTAKKGDIVGLIGRNGAGKTTLLNVLSGILSADSGQILVDGQVAQPEFFTMATGYLPDKLDLYDYLTLQENIDFVLKVRGLEDDESRRYLTELLTEFNLSDQLKTSLKDLSKGMRQKFNFVMTLVHKPTLLLLDEPFDGLDPKQIMVMKRRIKQLSKQGTLVIFSSHILSFVTDLCNRVIFIKAGQLQQITEMVGVTEKDLMELFDEIKS